MIKIKRAINSNDNVYLEARYNAEKYNESLRSREGAADILGVERSRIYKIEKNVDNPHPDEVVMMADAYNAPELLNYYCTEQCPIGKLMVPKVDNKSIESWALNTYTALNKAINAKDEIIDIAKDGIISEEEKPRLKVVLNILDEIAKATNELKIHLMRTEK